MKPLFDEAREYGIDIVLGYAERTPDGTGYNTCVYYSGSEGRVMSKYRKVHLPGTKEPFEDPNAINQLEKRYFTPGDLGFKAFRTPGLVPNAIGKAAAKEDESTVGKGDPIMGMLICNDRRWPEAWRMYSLQGAELIMFGFNTGGVSLDRTIIFINQLTESSRQFRTWRIYGDQSRCHRRKQKRKPFSTQGWSSKETAT